MRITVVMGFFLPMPPAAGGATEKSWHELALEFARRGHEVTIVSRTWRDWPQSETRGGVHYLRIPGNDHTDSRASNLGLDFAWSLRARRVLPASDVTVANCIALPVFLGLARGKSGKLVVMPGRMPKGQYRAYRRVDRVLAVSSPVRDAVLAENPGLAPVTGITGYPIHWGMHATPSAAAPGRPVCIGFVGRIHPEKGLGLLAAALTALSARDDLPAWHAIFCGPEDIARGGGGEAYAHDLRSDLPTGRCEFLPAEFNEHRLAEIYRQIDIFCYPSIAERGETFGVSVVEAMAAGAVPVVSNLRCFADYLRTGENGRTFDHRSADAVDQLTTILADLICSAEDRQRLGTAARAAVRRYDFPAFADRLLVEFAALNRP